MPRHRRSTAPAPLFSPATLGVDLPAAVESRRDGDELRRTAERVSEAVERTTRTGAVDEIRRLLGYEGAADAPDDRTVAFESVAPDELAPHGRDGPTRRLVSRLASDDGPDWGVSTDGRYWRLHGGTPDEERYHEVDVSARANAGPESLEPFVALFSRGAFAGAGRETGEAGDAGFAAALLDADEDRRSAVRERLGERTATAVSAASHSDRVAPAAAFVARLAFDLFVADRTGRSALVETDELAAARRALPDAVAKSGETPTGDALASPHVETLRRWTRAAARADPTDAFDLPERLSVLSASRAELARIADAADPVRLAELLAAVPAGGSVVGVDYRSVDARHLGAVYERLLARGAFADDSSPSVAGRRKDEGSFYTPDSVVSYVVGRTVRPLAVGVRRELDSPVDAADLEERVREARVLDPAMGTGHFLVAATGCLADALRETAREGGEPVVPGADLRARIVSDCVYGVDRDLRATDIAKLTLWAETLGEGTGRSVRPSLSDRLVTGDSLLGSASDLFPSVFEGSGDGVGFDAVVGNPPWKGTAGRSDVSARLSGDVRSSLREAFESAGGSQPNLAAAFLERGRELAPEGRLGFVVPDAVLVRLGAESLRRYLLREGGVTHLLRVGSVFPDANEGAAVVVGAREGRDPILSWYGDAEAFAEAAATGEFDYGRLPRSVVESERYARFQLLRDDDADAIFRRLERLDAVSTRASVGRGEEFGKRDDRIADAPGEGRVPIVSGAAVRPYGIRPDAVRYVDAEAVTKDVYDPPKLVARQTGGFLVAAVDEAGTTNLKSVYDVHVDHDDPETALRHLLGMVNSTVYNYYHYVRRNAYPAQFPQQNQRNYETLPVWSGETDAELVGAVETRVELARTRLALDTDVRSYVAFEDADVPLAALDPTPADDLLLSAHRGTTPGLRIDSLRVRTEGSDAVVSISYERDGETTTPREALRFEDAPEDVRTVLRAWLSAVSDASVADRRATGLRRVGRSVRTTPAARLRSLRVPDPSKHAEAMARYLAARDRHSSLTDRARRIDDRIDRRVANLVGLTDAQLDAVRSTMAGVDGWSSLRP